MAVIHRTTFLSVAFRYVNVLHIPGWSNEYFTASDGATIARKLYYRIVRKFFDRFWKRTFLQILEKLKKSLIGFLFLKRKLRNKRKSAWINDFQHNEPPPYGPKTATTAKFGYELWHHILHIWLQVTSFCFQT